MEKWRPEVTEILEMVHVASGRPIRFMRDDSLSLMATIQLARDGAEYHLLRYKPGGRAVDYFVAHQAAFALRFFNVPRGERCDFGPSPEAGRIVSQMIESQPNIDAADWRFVPEFGAAVAKWALLCIRSIPIGMRVDQWLSEQYPRLRDLQADGLGWLQQQNANTLAQNLNTLSVPNQLRGPEAAFALFADRLAGNKVYTIPYDAMGLLDAGINLLAIWDGSSGDPKDDRALVDAWSAQLGLESAYRWIPHND